MKKTVISLVLLFTPLAYGMDTASPARTKRPRAEKASVLTNIFASYDAITEKIKTLANDNPIKKALVKQLTEKRTHFEFLAQFVTGQPDTCGHETYGHNETTNHYITCEYTALKTLFENKKTRYFSDLKTLLAKTKKQEKTALKALMNFAEENGFEAHPSAQPTFNDLEIWHSPATDTLIMPEDCFCSDIYKAPMK